MSGPPVQVISKSSSGHGPRTVLGTETQAARSVLVDIWTFFGGPTHTASIWTKEYAQVRSLEGPWRHFSGLGQMVPRGAMTRNTGLPAGAPGDASVGEGSRVPLGLPCVLGRCSQREPEHGRVDDG